MEVFLSRISQVKSIVSRLITPSLSKSEDLVTPKNDRLSVPPDPIEL